MPRAIDHPTPSRRLLLALAGLGPLAAFAAPAGSHTRAADADADAELIRLCAENAAVLRANNRSDDLRDSDDHPLFPVYLSGQKAIEALPPRTIAGVVAKARLAKIEAIEASMGNGETWDGASSGSWARDVVNDLLRLHGETVA